MKLSHRIRNCCFWYEEQRRPPGTKPERELFGAGPADIPIIHTLYDAYAAWHHLVLRFPKAQRYTLGEACAKHLLAALELLLDAASRANPIEKAQRLRAVSAKIDTLKLLIRLAHDCRCIANAQYLDMESRLHEIGKMLGGWIKSLRQ